MKKYGFRSNLFNMLDNMESKNPQEFRKIYEELNENKKIVKIKN